MGLRIGKATDRGYSGEMESKEPKEDGNTPGKGELLRVLPPTEQASARAPWVAVIRRLNERHRARIARHLQALEEHDRYLRFGYAANDDQIQAYVNTLEFERDTIFGIYNRRLELVAMAHLAYSIDRKFDACAEFGVSVVPSVRGHGYGGKLFARAMRHARNEGVQLMFIHALSENKPMLSIARKAGAKVEYDGSEAQAYLRLPPATFETQVAEMLEEGFAETDYRMKVQARHFWEFLKGLQDVRQGVRDARHKSGA